MRGAGWAAASGAAALAAYTLGAEYWGRFRDPRIFRRGAPDRPAIALTFDDGPHARLTARTLDLLARAEAPASFFCVGERVRAHPEVVRRALREGHLLGNHTDRHRHAWVLTPAALRREVARGAAALQDATGQAAGWLRPPWGAFNATTFAAARAVGQRIALWSIAPPDWMPGIRPEAITAYVLGRAHPGAVVDLHDGGQSERATEAMLAALPAILEGLRQRGYEFQRLDVLAEGASAP